MTRLDKFLAAELPNYSRSFLVKCRLCVNGAEKKPAARVRANDKIEVAVPPLKVLKIQPEKIPLDVVFEDTTILILNKPTGMVVHPTDRGGHVSGTLVNALLAHFRQSALAAEDGVRGDRAGLVHRLDRDTSGVIVIAKTAAARTELSRQFADREVRKTYLALVAGRIRSDRGRIEASLGRHPRDRTRQRVSLAADARKATTDFEVVERFKDVTLVRVHPLTGRTHQIRVHFASLQHPVVGDPLYGTKKINAAILTRLFLHAEKIGFTHPATKKLVEFSAPLPPDLAAVLEKVKKANIRR